MFGWFNNKSKRNLNELTNDELMDLGVEFTEEGEKALAIVQDRQNELIDIYKKAYSEFGRKNYPLAVKYLNKYMAVAEKYGEVVINAVFELFISITKENSNSDDVLSVYDTVIDYYNLVSDFDSASKFEQGKCYYKSLINL